MKRVFILLLVLLICFSMFACENAPVLSTTSVNTTFNELPGEFTCGEYRLSLQDVSFAQVYANKGYTGYVIVTLDRSTLSDDDAYWLLNRINNPNVSPIDAVAYLQQKDGGESVRLSLLKKTYDEHNIYYVFWTDLQRQTFNGDKIRVQIVSSPEEKLNADSTKYYYYTFNLDSNLAYSSEELSSSEQDVLLNAIRSALKK